MSDVNQKSSICSQHAEVNSKMDKRGRISHTKFEISREEREDIFTNLGDTAVLLYQFYLRMASIPDAAMEDSNAASYLFWSTRKVARVRKLLENAGYFRKITYKSNAGKKTITYYISRDSVAKS